MGHENRKRLLQLILAFAAVYIIWGTTYLGIRVAVQTIPPFLMAGIRFTTAGLIIFIFLRLRGRPIPQRRHWLPAIIVGTLLLAGGSGMLSWAEKEVPSGIAALVVATVPLWFALFDWLFFHHQRPGKRVIAGLLIGFIGIILLIGPEQFIGPARFSWLSLLLLILSPIIWSAGSLYSRQADLPPDTFMSTALQMLAAGVVMFGTGLLTGEVSQVDMATIAPASILSLLYLIFFGSIIAYSAYVWLIKNVQATKVATYAYVNPVIAVFLGWFILDEKITPLMIAAVVIILLAVILITGKSKDNEIVGEISGVPILPE